MKNLLAILLAFFRLGVGDPDPNADPDLDLGGNDPDPDPQGDPDPNLNGDPDPQGDPEPDYRAQLEAERQARADDRARADRYEREAADLRANQSRSAPNPQHDEEERILRDPQATELQKWQITANRELRAGRTRADQALAQAHDVSDRTQFSQWSTKNPALHKKYEARVEQELANIRSKGGNAAREAILSYLVGQDALNGKLTRKAAPANNNQNLNRGKLPGARSDTNGRNALSERDKRRARLENVNI